jgi:hypothetical protein
VACEVAQGERGSPETRASAKAGIRKLAIPLLKELTYCSFSSQSVSSGTLPVVETGLIGQLARVEADDGFSHEV